MFENDFNSKLAGFDYFKKYVDGGFLLTEIIWNSENWCDKCITTPLFKIYNEDENREYVMG
ncbi:hypothetical protein, partial [Pseudomonas poae]|uniref:hypothetical protein n=1 Tax=Pseudomonas poae TaxID=200451 RepID=UPI0034D6F5BF